MTPILETTRLVLRPLELADADQVQPLFACWEVVEYLNSRVPWPYPPDGALTYYRDVTLPAAAKGLAWDWTLRLKTEPERIIGGIGLSSQNIDNRGFWIGVPWRGQGLMTEACDAVTDYWFNTLGFPVLRVSKAIGNTASRRISLRQGMRVVERLERDYVCGRLPAEVWEITVDEWNTQRQRG